MAENKRITLDWDTTGLTVYCIIRREVDDYRLNDADGAFADAPADPYVSLTEDSVIKMRYEKDEARTVWTDGRYTIAIYSQAGGSPVPASDTIIGTGELYIKDDIETVLDYSISSISDIVWDESLTGANHNIPTSAGRRLRAIGDVVSGSVNDASATTTSFITDLTGTQTDHYSDQTLLWTSGALAGMSRSVLTYDESTKEVTIEEALPEPPANGDDFDINPVHIHPVSQIAAEIWDEVLTGGTHNITDSAGRRIRNLQEFGDYEHDSVWIDTSNGLPGTTDYESGTINNKVDTIADANTIGLSLNKSGRAIVEGSSITLAASQENQNLWGNNWTLALGGQSISGTHVEGADVSGICSGANEPEFHECHVGNITVPPCVFKDCDLDGIIILPVGEVHLHDCSGESGLVLDYGASIANTTVHATVFSGDLIIDNLGANGVDVLDIRGHGKITLNASCVGGTINWDGHFTFNNNGSGITINSDDISSNVDAIIAMFSGITSMPNWLRALFRKDAADATALTEINSGGGAYDEATDSNEGLKGQIDAISAGIIVVGAGGSVTPSYAEEGEPEDIVQGDVINKPRYVTDDQSAKRIFFGAKTATGDTSYAIGLIECTVGEYDAVEDQTSYFIPFVAADTKAVTAGTYKGESEVRDADGTSNPVTADRFDLNVIGEIIT